ncbi:MAG: DUF4388 domain-containing protein [Desulfobacterales bacterium]|nr:DUF4388 domain-containing protein [Desulfobacterales bacterium]
MSLLKKTDSDASNGQLRPFLDRYSTKSRFAESYRTLRTNIHFSFMEKTFQSLIVSSAGQAEGKTSTVYNLAYTMAQAGLSVLMIDADLRKPMLSASLAVPASAGLTGLIAGTFATEVKAGALDEIGVGDLLRLVAFQKKTGRLELAEASEKVVLVFLRGKLVDLSWVTRPEEKKLAHALVRDKVLSQEQVRSALGRQKDSGQRLGFVLISMGLLRDEDLKGLLTIHMLEGFRTAMQMTTGRYRFVDQADADVDHPAFNPIDFAQLYRQLTLGEEPLGFLQEKINQAVVSTDQKNLFMLPSGNLPPNPSELLGSERMAFLLTQLKKRFDRLIIDTPPILPASDALLLAPAADGVVLVVKGGHMNREPVRAVVDQLRVAQANLIGVVLNQIDVKKEGYYKYYHKYYGGSKSA